MYGGASDPVKESGTGVFILAGEYEFEVTSAKWKRSDQSYKRSNAFILNLKVLQSNNPARPVGTVCDYVQRDAKKDGTPNTRFWENVKKPLIHLLGAKGYEEIDETVMKMVCEGGAAVGKRVHCVATDIQLDSGAPYTTTVWSPSILPSA